MTQLVLEYSTTLNTTTFDTGLLQNKICAFDSDISNIHCSFAGIAERYSLESGPFPINASLYLQ